MTECAFEVSAAFEAAHDGNKNGKTRLVVSVDVGLEDPKERTGWCGTRTLTLRFDTRDCAAGRPTLVFAKRGYGAGQPANI